MQTSSSETALIIEDSVRRVFDAGCTSARLKSAEGHWDEALWRELDDSGFTYALEPAGHAELGIAIPDALNIVRLSGAYAAPVPLAENMLANWLIRRAGLAFVAGPVSIAPTNRGDRVVLEQAQAGWRITGKVTRVPWGRYAAALLVVAQVEDECFVAVVPRSGFGAIEQHENLAREPRDHLELDATLPAEAVAHLAGGAEYAYAMGAAMRVLQMAGALDAVLRLTTQYAQDRQQFGRAIGKFQAIQQNVAVMAANIAAARAAANSVVQIIGNDGSLFGIAAAKVRSSEAVAIAARTAHQVHGAMGFTQEYQLHFLTKRLWSWRDEFGNEVEWSRKLGRAVCARGADGLWEFITAEMA